MKFSIFLITPFPWVLNWLVVTSPGTIILQLVEWSISKVKKTETKFQTRKKKKPTQVLHSVFKSFTNMTTDLASIALVHTHTHNRHPSHWSALQYKAI